MTRYDSLRKGREAEGIATDRLLDRVTGDGTPSWMKKTIEKRRGKGK